MVDYVISCSLSTAEWDAKLNTKNLAPIQPSLYTQGEDL